MIRFYHFPHTHFPRFFELCWSSGPGTRKSQIYGFGESRRALGSTHFTHPQLAGRMGHRRRSESHVLPSREPHAGIGVSAVERAETVLNRWALGKRPEPLRSRLRSLQRNPQLGGSLLTGHYGRLLWRPSAPKYHNWRLSPPLPTWKPTPPLFLGDAAEYRRRRQLRRREARRLQHRRSPLTPLPEGTKWQLMDREPRLQLLLDEHQNYFRKPSGMRTWIARRRQRLQLRQAYHRPRHCQWLAELLRQAYPQSRGLAWLALRSGYADGLSGLRKLTGYDAGPQQTHRALLRLLRGWGSGLRRSLPRRRLVTFSGATEGRPGGLLTWSEVGAEDPPAEAPVFWGNSFPCATGGAKGYPPVTGTTPLVAALDRWQEKQNRPRPLPLLPKLVGVRQRKHRRWSRFLNLRRSGKRWQSLGQRCRRTPYPLTQTAPGEGFFFETQTPAVALPFRGFDQNPLQRRQRKTPGTLLQGTSALLFRKAPRESTWTLRRPRYYRLPRCPRGVRRVRRPHPFRWGSRDSRSLKTPLWRLWRLRRILWQSARLLGPRLRRRQQRLRQRLQPRRPQPPRRGSRGGSRGTLRGTPETKRRRRSLFRGRRPRRVQPQPQPQPRSPAVRPSGKPTSGKKASAPATPVDHPRRIAPRLRGKQPRKAQRRLKRLGWRSLRTCNKKDLRLRRRRRFSKESTPRPPAVPEGRPLRREQVPTNPAPDLPFPTFYRRPQENSFGKGSRWLAPTVRGGCLYLRGSWRRLWVANHPRLGRRVLLGRRWRTRRWRRVRYHWGHGPLRRAVQRLRRRRRSFWSAPLNHRLQLARGADRRGCRRVNGAALLFNTLLGRLLLLLEKSGPAATPFVASRGNHREFPIRPLRTPLRQRLRLLQRAAAAAAGGRPLPPVLAGASACQTHPGLRLGLQALTTQEHLGRRNHRSRRRGPWLRDWLRQCYMPPRMAEKHRLRSSCTPGLRYWFQKEELALLEPWQKPAHLAGWWQQEASGYQENPHPRNSEMGLWMELIGAYHNRFDWKRPTYTRRRRVAQRRPICWALRRLPRQRLPYSLALGLLTLGSALPLLAPLRESALLEQMRTLCLSVNSRPMAHGLQECGWAPNYRVHRYVAPYARWWQSMGRNKWIYHDTPLLRDNGRHWLRLSVHPEGAAQSHHFRQVIARQMAFASMRNRTLNLILAPRRNNLRVIIQPWVVRDGWRDRVFERSAGQVSRFKGRLRRSPEIKRQLYQLAAFRLLRHHKKDRRFRFMRVVFKHYLESLPPHFHRPEQMRRQLWGLLGPFRRKQVSMRYPIVGLQTTESYSNRPRGYRRRSRKHVRRPKAKRY